MRISDWSSDVCSSDLPLDAAVDALDDVGRRAPVEAETPGIAAKARTPQVGAQRSGRPVAGQKTWQHHHRRVVAVGIWFGRQRADAAAERLEQSRSLAPQQPQAWRRARIGNA